MKKNKTKAHNYLFIIAILLICIFGTSFTNVNAQDADSVDTTIKVERTINIAPPVVSNKFTYTITPESNNPAPVTGLTNTFEILFSNMNAPEAKAVAHKNIDFNDVVYTKPGDYKFKVKETDSIDSVSYPLSEDEWMIIISVRYKIVDGVPTRKLITKSFALEDKNENKKDDTTINFTGNAKFSSIRISNQTDGNMANLDKYFKIKVDIRGNDGETYSMTGQDSTVNYNGTSVTTSTTYTVGQENYVYLKDDQEVTIGRIVLGGSSEVEGSEVKAKDTTIQNEIKIGTKYKVEEIGAEAYKTYINDSAKPNKVSDVYTLEETEGRVKILNIYEAELITGTLLKYLPYVLILLIATLFLVILLAKRRKREEEF